MSSPQFPDVQQLVAIARQKYESLWCRAPVAGAYGPGRVNLIGDHTDYNDGLVFPMAIPAYTVVLGGPSDSAECTIETVGADIAEEPRAQFKVDNLEPGLPLWANYVKGVVAMFPGPTRSFNAVIASSVPLGAGLSSSAALEVAMFLFLESLNGTEKLTIDEKAKLCQKAEHTFAGMPCGIMDQLISLSGEEGSAVLIDCRTLDTEAVPLTNNDFVFVVTNSNVKHELASSEYANRRRSCEQAASMLGKNSLRDVSMRELESSLPALDQDLYRTARHVITEIERTGDAAEALKRGEVSVFGALMTQSHISLRDDYKVSCSEIDEIVEIALETEGVLGSRITGGGFGGCAVSLVRADRAQALIDNIAQKYHGNANSYTFLPGAGGKILELKL